jgi:hypothetical protein
MHHDRRRDPVYRHLQHPIPAGYESRPGLHAQGPSILLFIVAAGINVEGIGEAKNYVPEEITEEEAPTARPATARCSTAPFSSLLCVLHVHAGLRYLHPDLRVLPDGRPDPVDKKKNYGLFAIITVITTIFFYIVFTRICT